MELRKSKFADLVNSNLSTQVLMILYANLMWDEVAGDNMLIKELLES